MIYAGGERASTTAISPQHDTRLEATVNGRTAGVDPSGGEGLGWRLYDPRNALCRRELQGCESSGLRRKAIGMPAHASGRRRPCFWSFCQFGSTTECCRWGVRCVNVSLSGVSFSSGQPISLTQHPARLALRLKFSLTTCLKMVGALPTLSALRGMWLQCTCTQHPYRLINRAQAPPFCDTPSHARNCGSEFQQ